MHTCIVSATSEFGGVEHHILSLARFLRSRGHEVTLAILGKDVFSGRVQIFEPRLDMVHVPCDFWRMGYREAAKCLRRLPGDSCVFQKGGFDAGTLGFQIAARMHFRRFITIEQLEADPIPFGPTNYYWGLIPRLGLWRQWVRFTGFCRSLAPWRVLCVSQAVQNRLQRQYRFPSRKLVLAANGVDVSLFRRDEEARARLRREINASDETLVFGAIARFAPVKRLDIAIQCFGDLLAAHPMLDARLVLYGEGTERKRLQELITERSLEGKAQLRPFTDQPCEALSSFDIFLMPSVNEGLPFALLQAMACENFPIATAVGGNGEAIGPECGALVPAGNSKAFLDAMETACRLTPMARVQCGRAARERVSMHFNSHSQMELITSLLEASSAC